MPAGILSDGGSLDRAFDLFRGSLGESTTRVIQKVDESFRLRTDRSSVERVLYVYQIGLKEKRYQPFTGEADPTAVSKVQYIKTSIALDDDLIYYILYACWYLAQHGSASCANVIAGQGINFVDEVVQGDTAQAIGNQVSGFWNALGLPSLSTIAVVLIVLAIIGAIVYWKVMKR
jgi:hypothetical protein